MGGTSRPSGQIDTPTTANNSLTPHLDYYYPPPPPDDILDTVFLQQFVVLIYRNRGRRLTLLFSQRVNQP